MKLVGELMNVEASLRALWPAANQPVSFIEPAGGLQNDLQPQGKTAAAVLDSIVASNAALQWRQIRGRYVLYPKRESWDETVSGVPAGEVPRIDAADALVRLIRAQHPDLADLSEPPIKGDPGSPVYKDRVAMHPGQSILENLIHLLGDNERLAFVVERAPSGVRVLHFQVVSTD